MKIRAIVGACLLLIGAVAPTGHAAPAPRFATDAAPIVAIGDSITAVTPVGGAGWPALLSARLHVRVADRGIGSNAVALQYLPKAGPALVDRFAADALAVRGVRTVIILEGHNDIRYDARDRTAAVIAGLTRVIRQAHAAHVRVLCATLVPWGREKTDTPLRERERAAVNAWIRAPGHCDGMIDVARALADPHDPLAMRAAYDSGDGIHPNPRGQAVIADAAARVIRAR